MPVPEVEVQLAGETGARRESWGSRSGFLLASIGSAVGLGNMWRFSYLTAENGGGAFVVLYIGLTIGLALPMLLAELTIGRGAGRSPITALAHYGGPRWSVLGIYFALIAFVILSYYSVIAGWTARYAFESLVFGMPADSGAHFGSVSQGSGALLWHLGFCAATALIVGRGLERGIERAAKLLTPLLFALIVAIAIYAATLEGGGAGYRFYLSTDFSKIGDPELLLAAAGQAFFSVSVGIGVMLTYASYLPPGGNLPRQSLIIALADFAVAFTAGLAIFPLLFALGMQESVQESTMGTLFVVLPGAFARLGLAGQIVGTLFFLALAVAALTSTISLLEGLTASLMDRFGIGRRGAAYATGCTVALVGAAPALEGSLLGEMDRWAGNVGILIGALLLSLFVGWFMPEPHVEAARGSGALAWLKAWRWLLRIPAPLALALILYRSFFA